MSLILIKHDMTNFAKSRDNTVYTTTMLDWKRCTHSGQVACDIKSWLFSGTPSYIELTNTEMLKQNVSMFYSILHAL